MQNHQVKADYKLRGKIKFSQKTKSHSRLKKVIFPFFLLPVLVYFYNISSSSSKPEELSFSSRLVLKDNQKSSKLPFDRQHVKAQIAESSDLFPGTSFDSPLDASSSVTLQVKSGDNLARLFNEAGLSSKQLNQLIQTSEHTKELEQIFPGQVLSFHISPEGELTELSKHITPIKTLKVELQEDGSYQSAIHEREIERKMAFGSAAITDSLFQAGKRANLNDKLIMSLADIFAYDIDFAMDINPNDRFKVLYEEYYAEGKKVGTGHILRAEFNTRDKTYQAIRYTDKNGKTAYYTPDGHSLHKSFTRNPVEHTRISSHFNLQRRHPILHKIRAHRGVDYAAPRGTPIRAVGDGRITFLGKKGGYGNVIELQHGPKYSTLYGHMQRFASNLRDGQTVKQGQVIGYVGSSGLATGPHLHYEFRINGVHKNPLTVALPRGGEGTKIQDPKFFAMVKETDSIIRIKEDIMLARALLDKSEL
jgi:murein DD-endopeptidase MepM/ murein hydrolase activator NlpD